VKYLRAAWIAAFALAGLVAAIAALLAATAKEVRVVTPHDPAVVALNRELDAPSPEDPDFARKVMELYGNPLSEPWRVLFVPDERILHPEEMPALALLPVDKDRGENPLEVKTVLFLARWIGGGGLAAGAVLLAAWAALRRRQ